MTTEEAREMIKREMLDGFAEWLKDEEEMPDNDFGWKYGLMKGEIRHNDDLKSFMVYREYIFTGRWLHKWIKAGYPKEVIWELNRENFLSYREYWGHEARATGKTEWYFISQRVAKQIWKEAHKKR